MKFRKKPVVVDAIEWRGPKDDPALCNFIPGNLWCHNSEGEPCIKTLESRGGFHVVSAGDWIIKGVAGEFYPCKPDIFAATYEPAGEPPSDLRQYVAMLLATYGLEEVMTEVTTQWQRKQMSINDL